jgi:HEAT repeat protein
MTRIARRHGSGAARRAALVTLAALGGCASTPEEPLSANAEATSAGNGPAPHLSPLEPVSSSADRDTLWRAAIDLLLEAAASDDPLLRANAIEALQEAPQYLDQVLASGLGDANRGVRFVAAMTVGRLELGRHAPAVEPLLEDESRSVRAAAVYALRRCGRPVDLNPLAGYVADGDPEVRANAAMVLAELGNRSAAPVIRDALGRRLSSGGPTLERIVALQLAEALVMLGERREIEVIRAALFTPVEQGEITALACMMCGRLGDRGATADLSNLALRTGEGEQPPEIRMAATYALGLMEPGRAPAEVPRAFLASSFPEQRAQAAITLGAIGDPAALSSLGPILNDSNPRVQVAAAAAILMITG